MSKVTYLIGAGASCNCLPVVKDVPGRLESLYHFIKSNPPGSGNFDSPSIEKSEVHADLVKECENLKNYAAAHSSIDTYAKKLFINDRPEYIKLKTILSFSFIWDQTLKPVDPRYDTFFASILGKSDNDFKGDIRIVSWNYDYQFEKAYSQYSEVKSLEQNQNRLNVTPSNADRVMKGMEDKFSIYKLNGTTGFYGPNNVGLTNVTDDLFKTSDEGLGKSFLEHYYRTIYSKDFTSLMAFAWEKNEKEISKLVVTNALKNIQNSVALVIIGYSFPFFNRDVDKDIFRSLSSVRKIYIQDPLYDNIASNILSVIPADPNTWEKKFVKVSNLDQFYLPAEL